MTDFFRESPWPGLTLWVVLFLSDYALTIACARLYRAQDKVVFEGSYEITPYYQADINALRLVSPRFLLMLGLSSALLWLLWELSVQPYSWSEEYPLGLGMFVGLQLAVHVRHLRNLVYFRALRADEVRGHLEYPRPLMLRMSTLELLVFAAAFCVLSIVVGSWFMLGAALASAVTAWKHNRLARQQAGKQ